MFIYSQSSLHHLPPYILPPYGFSFTKLKISPNFMFNFTLYNPPYPLSANIFISLKGDR